MSTVVVRLVVLCMASVGAWLVFHKLGIGKPWEVMAPLLGAIVGVGGSRLVLLSVLEHGWWAALLAVPILILVAAAAGACAIQMYFTLPCEDADFAIWIMAWIGAGRAAVATILGLLLTPLAAVFLKQWP